jgi:hypothetical protein
VVNQPQLRALSDALAAHADTVEGAIEDALEVGAHANAPLPQNIMPLLVRAPGRWRIARCRCCHNNTSSTLHPTPTPYPNRKWKPPC